jgi:hypothetical protein
MDIYDYIAIAILLLIIFVVYRKNKEHLMVGSEPVLNVAKIYADASGTVSFNNVNSAGNLTTKNISANNINSAGNLTTNDIWAKSIKTNASEMGDSHIKTNLLRVNNFVTNNITGNDRNFIYVNTKLHVTGDISANNIINNKLRVIDISANNITISGNLNVPNDKNYVWGIKPNNEVWRCLAPCNGSWEKINGTLKQISVGQEYLYGLNSSNEVHRCKKPCNTGEWGKINGEFSQIYGDNFI